MRIFICNECSKIHVEIGNILFNFTNKEKLANYLNMLDSIDAEYYTSLNINKLFTKDIFIPIANTGISLSFTLAEFNKLRKTIRTYLSDLTYYL